MLDRGSAFSTYWLGAVAEGPDGEPTTPHYGDRTGLAIRWPASAKPGRRPEPERLLTSTHEPSDMWHLGRPSYEVCPRCGFEFGNDDNPGTAPPASFEQYRREWEAEGRPWFDRESGDRDAPDDSESSTA